MTIINPDRLMRIGSLDMAVGTTGCIATYQQISWYEQPFTTDWARKREALALVREELLGAIAAIDKKIEQLNRERPPDG